MLEGNEDESSSSSRRKKPCQSGGHLRASHILERYNYLAATDSLSASAAFPTVNSISLFLCLVRLMHKLTIICGQGNLRIILRLLRSHVHPVLRPPYRYGASFFSLARSAAFLVRIRCWHFVELPTASNLVTMRMYYFKIHLRFHLLIACLHYA